MKKCPQIEQNAFGFCFYRRRYFFLLFLRMFTIYVSTRVRCVFFLTETCFIYEKNKIVNLFVDIVSMYFSNVMDSISHFLRFFLFHKKKKNSRGFFFWSYAAPALIVVIRSRDNWHLSCTAHDDVLVMSSGETQIYGTNE